MHNSEVYEQELLKALIHLNDPNFQPSESLFNLIGLSPKDGVLSLEVSLLRAIEDLKPTTNMTSTSQTGLYYDLLHKRFVQKLTQEETAEHLHVSRTGIYRLQLKAVHILARQLWGQSHIDEDTQDRKFEQKGGEEQAKGLPDDQRLSWPSQVQSELESLEKSAPHSLSNVGEVISNVQELIALLISQLGSRLVVHPISPNLVADTHPSLLAQMLIMILERLADYGTGGEIVIKAWLEERYVRIELIRTNLTDIKDIDKEIITDILIPDGASIETATNDTQVLVSIKLPSTSKIIVLVVDDNLDMALFYRRCTEKTKYSIVHIRKGQELFETVEAVTPNVIVLDIVLPDVDGWRLLMRLHQNPATELIPIIICSVVRDEALALSLGARLCLSKPVRPKQFLQALDQVLPPA